MATQGQVQLRSQFTPSVPISYCHAGILGHEVPWRRDEFCCHHSKTEDPVSSHGEVVAPLRGGAWGRE
jgi:hypothetical protein